MIPSVNITVPWVFVTRPGLLCGWSAGVCALRWIRGGIRFYFVSLIVLMHPMRPCSDFDEGWMGRFACWSNGIVTIAHPGAHIVHNRSGGHCARKISLNNALMTTENVSQLPLIS